MKQSKYMIISAISNFFLSIIKIGFGYFFKVNSIMSDGFHSLSDLITDFVAIFGLRMSMKKDDFDHPLGHGKFEYITSMMVGFFIIFFAYELLISILNSTLSIPSTIGIYVVGFTILVKVCLSTFLIRKGKQLDNQIYLSSGRESMNDVYSSIVVIVGLIVSQFDFKYSEYVDKGVAVVIVLFIVKTGIFIIRDNIKLLMGVSCDKTIIDKLICSIIKEFPEVKDIDKFLLLKYGPYNKAIIDIQVDGKLSVEEGHEITHKLTKFLLKKDNIDYVKIHVEPYWGKRKA